MSSERSAVELTVEDRLTALDLRAALVQLRLDLIREFSVSGSYNRTAVWQGINRVFSDERLAALTPESSNAK